MKNKFLKIMAVVCVLSTVSCEDWLDVNDSPNTPLIDQIPPQLLLSAAQTETYKMISGDTENTSADISTSNLNQLGNIFMNSWAGNSNNTTGAYANEYSVSLTASFYDNIWDYGYRNINNLDNLANYDSANFDNHKAIAMILKSFYMQYIVDLYGDCPYSQAFLGAAEPTPAYDDDQAIYRALVDQIDAAVAKIHGADANDATVAGEDVMFAGDMVKWEKFANTVKLRLLVRESGIAASLPYLNAEIAEFTADPNHPFIGFMDSDVTINPGYNSSTADQQNPFYASYGYSITGGGSGQRAFVTASRFAAQALNGTNSGVVDGRRGRLFTLQGGVVVGIQQGDDAAQAPDNPSFIGPALIPDPTVTTPPSPTIIAAGSSQDSYVMTLSEIDFLLAEAGVVFGNPIFGDPKTNFDNGITASFTRLGAPLGTYLTQIDGQAGFGWTATANKIQAIMYQKWIALMHVNGGESWIDQLRTGFPVVPLAVTNVTGKPKRLMYPTSEYTANSGNLPAQTAANAFATGPFWLP